MILAFSVIFLILTCVMTKCGKTKGIPRCLHISMLVKIVLTLLMNLTCLVMSILLLVTSRGIAKKDVDFYTSTACVESYVMGQIQQFEPFYKSVNTNVMVIFICCFLQNVYEGLIYPSIKFKWIGRWVTFYDGEGPEFQEMEKKEGTVSVTQTKTTQITPAGPPMMVPAQPMMMQQPMPGQVMPGQPQLGPGQVYHNGQIMNVAPG